MDNISHGSCTNEQSKFQVLTDPCQIISHDAIVSEKYDIFWQLLCENFQGIKTDAFPDWKVIYMRMRDGSYSRCPQLFFEDLRQLGLKFQKIGAEVVSLAKGFSDGCRGVYSEQAGGSANGTCLESKHVDIDRVRPGNVDCPRMDGRKHYPSTESNQHSQLNHTDSDKNCIKICTSCGGKTEGRSIIVCDSCEKMYHIYCVGVSVTEGSPRIWYCNNCVPTGLETQHENCAVCQRANMCEDLMDAMTNGTLVSADEKCNHRLEADISQVTVKGTPHLSCKICRCEILNGSYRECEHYACNYKFHLRCLSELQLKRFGPRWYCCSCLCRVCLIDRDDEKIVLCDGCDNAYHIYCMEPPRSCVPEGDWFCRVCQTKLEAIRKAKMMYEKLHGKENGGGVKTALKSMGGVLSEAKMVYTNENSVTCVPEREQKDIGRVDMLLSAAEHLNEHEKLNQQQATAIETYK